MGKIAAIVFVAVILAWAGSALGQERLEDAPVIGEGAYEEFDDPFAAEGAEVEVRDPLEPFNRGMFWVNDKLYFYLLKPVARAYRLVPEPGRRGVDNFFVNLGAPVRMVNSLLQLKFRAAGGELRRFLFNSTLGIFGFLDPAAARGWGIAQEDLGQTLGHYRVGHGFYLVLPILGPANVRDGLGRIGDHFLDPLPYYLEETGELVAVKAYDRINAVSLDDDTYEKIKEEALDPYLFVRDAYMQRRRALIRQ